MIASLRGVVVHIGLDHAVIECAGVGYQVLMAPKCLATLTRGEEAFVHIATQVREGAMTLYGFDTGVDKDMFGVLQTVNGVGASNALAALAMFSPADISAAIRNKDSKTLQQIPRVGKRLAERLCLELKDKVDAFVDPTLVSSGTAEAVDTVEHAQGSTVVAALEGLGFTAAQATKAVNAVLSANPDASNGQLLKDALKLLSS